LFDSVSLPNIIVLFLVILIVVGPKRLPEVARKAGRMMEMFRRAADEFKDQLLSMDQEPSKSTGQPSPSGGAESAPSGEGDTTEGYGNPNPYPDGSDYPGNENHVENWASDAQDGASGNQDGEAAAETAAVDTPPDTPPERTA
jgi:TatA/E family protein of Tat protein translocase